MRIWLAVGLGGAIGAMTRHLIAGMFERPGLAGTFPLGIFIINVAGSTAIGLVAGLVASGRIQLSAELRTFAVAGILGGFTTFSSFSLDTLQLIRQGQIWFAALNAGGQVVLGLVAAAIGYRFGS